MVIKPLQTVSFEVRPVIAFAFDFFLSPVHVTILFNWMSILYSNMQTIN